MVRDSSEERLFPQPDMIRTGDASSLLGRGRGRKLAGYLVVLLLMVILAVPGIIAHQDNLDREQWAAESSEVITFETWCYLRASTDPMEGHYCDEPGFVHTIEGMETGDEIIMEFEFLSQINRSATSQSPYFNPVLEIVHQHSLLTLGVALGSYAYMVTEPGDYELRFSVNPMVSSTVGVDEMYSELFGLEMSLVVNPRVQEIPWISYLSWLPLTILVLVYLLDELRNR